MEESNLEQICPYCDPTVEDSQSNKHRYFISAEIKYTDWKFGFGHYEVESDFKIIDLEGVRTIARKIEETNNLPTGSVIILNFQLFDNV